MKTAGAVFLACVGFVVVGSLPADAEAAGAGPLVYVRDFVPGPGINPNDARNASVGFCHRFEKALGPEQVVCESAMRTLIQLSATRGALGAANNTASPALARLASVDLIVDTTLKQGKHGLILDARLYSALGHDAPQAEVYRFRKLGIKGGPAGCLDAHAPLAKRLVAKIQKPTVKSLPPPSTLQRQ